MVPLICRVVLGGVFLFAGLDKARHLADFAAQIAGYRLLPTWLITLAAVSMPWVEMVAGALLVAGFLAESSALVLGVLSLVFALAVGSALVRGLDIECGCLSTSASAVSWGHVGLDVVLVGLAVVVLVRGPGAWAVDRWLATPRSESYSQLQTMTLPPAPADASSPPEGE